MDKALYENYKAILAAEQTEAEQLAEERRQIDIRLEQVQSSIARITAKLATYKVPPTPQTSERPTFIPTESIPAAIPARLKFAAMSVRWAVLYLMSEGDAQLTTSQMAEALIAGGFRSTAQNFSANVSAVVSDMVRKKAELEPVDATGTYRITTKGRETWDTIRHGRQFRYSRLGVLTAANGTGQDHVM